MVTNNRPTAGLQGTPRATSPACRGDRQPLPTRVDILVVGGGLAGCATAYYLAKAGAEVLVVERDDINMHASGSNAGSIHAQIPHLTFIEEGDDWARTFAPTIPLLLASIDIWKGLSAELGSDLEVATPGGLLVAETEQQMRDVERKAAIERSHGMTIELVGRDDLRRLAPYVGEQMIGGAFSPQEGKANPLKATPAFAAAARRLGARIATGCEVTGTLRQPDGCFRLSTSHGEVTARRLVNAAGANAGSVAAMLGLRLPLLAEAIQVSVSEPAAPLVSHLVYFAGGRLTLKQSAQGTCLIGGGWPAAWSRRNGRPVVSLRSLRDNLRIACHVVPALAGLQLVRTWPAIVNGTADWKPVLGAVPGIPGYYMNFFPWLGFSAGPIAARIVADIVLGKDPGWDMRLFGAERYGIG